MTHHDRLWILLCSLMAGLFATENVWFILGGAIYALVLFALNIHGTLDESQP